MPALRTAITQSEKQTAKRPKSRPPPRPGRGKRQAAPTEPRNKTKEQNPKTTTKPKKTEPGDKNKKPTWDEAGTWASKLGLEKDLRSNAPVARGERPTTTAGGGGASRALARDEHVSKRLRGVAGGVNAGAAAKIGWDALGKWIHGGGDIRYRLSDISFGGGYQRPATSDQRPATSDQEAREGLRGERRAHGEHGGEKERKKEGRKAKALPQREQRGHRENGDGEECSQNREQDEEKTGSGG